MDEQAVAVTRMEDAGVFHDGLLTANAHRATHTGYRPLALADVAASREAELPDATCDLAPGPESAKAARDFTRQTLREWREAGPSATRAVGGCHVRPNRARPVVVLAQLTPGAEPL